MSNARDLAKAFGYLWLTELDELQRLARLIPTDRDTIIVNIGAGAGTSALAISEVMPSRAKLYTVDIRPTGPLGGLEGERNAFSSAGVEHPEQILGDSAEVGREWKNGEIDFLFVDGDHSESGVRADIESWLPHVRTEGIVVFHDYRAEVWPAVHKVVNELMEKYETIGHVDSIIAFRIKR